MTRRLYYDDSYRLEFDARVDEVVTLEDGRAGAVLDQTLFYPTSGGQMHDVGTLGGIAVVDVIDEVSRIVHVLGGDAPSVGSAVTGVIDAERRDHHRQQHTGQHVLSRVIEDGYGWPTISSRLGESMNTLEIGATEMPPELIREIEDRTNLVLWEGHPVRVVYLPEGPAEQEGLRKKVEREGPVRVIEVEGVDRCACGGTHVANTCEIGIVSIVGSEKMRGGTRLLFLCGQRAVQWRRERVEWLDGTARHLTTGMDLVHDTVVRLQDESRERRKRMENLARQLVRATAPTWRETAEPHGAYRVVLRVLEEDEALAAVEAIHAVVAEPGLCAALVVEDGKKRQVLFAVSESVDIDCGERLGRVLRRFEGRGGGQANFARGGCAGVTSAQIFDALREELSSDPGRRG